MATVSENDSKLIRKNKRKNVKLISLFQAFLAVILTSGWLYGGYFYCDFIPVPKSTDIRDTLIYFTRCCVLPCVVVLFFSILAVMNKRGSTPAANPMAGKDHFLQVEKNILANTVEQMLLFLFINIVLITYLGQLEMKLLPLYSSLWVIGRLFFNIGYRISHIYRGLGMMSNFFSSVFFLGLIFYLTYTRGLFFELLTTTSTVGAVLGDRQAKAEL